MAGIENGLFIDVGCNHPTKINNTYFFEKRGWRGIAIDALPLGELWQTRKAEFLQCAVGADEGSVQIDIPSEAAGLQNDDVVSRDMFSQVREQDAVSFSGSIANTITVPQMSLRKIMADRRITHVDYLSLDVEGYEEQVLKGIDFLNSSIDTISIENNRPFPYGRDDIRRFLYNQGYHFYARIHPTDDIFIKRSRLSLLERYAIRLAKDFAPVPLRGEL